MLRGDIRWEKGSDGRTYKFYNAAALERRGGGIGKGVNKGGEIIVTPAGIPVSSDRYARQTQGDYNVWVPQGSARKGIGQQVFGRGIGKGVDRALGTVGTAIPGLGDISAKLGGTAGYEAYQDGLKGVLGDRGARLYETVGQISRSVAAAVADIVAFGGMPLLTTANQALQAKAGQQMGEKGAVRGGVKNMAISWASYGALRGLDKLQASGTSMGNGVGGSRAGLLGDVVYESVTRPAAQIAIGTGAGMARGQKASDAALASAAGVASSAAGLGPTAQAGIRTGVVALSPGFRDAWSGGDRTASAAYLAGEYVIGYYGAGGFSKPAGRFKGIGDSETRVVQQALRR